MDDTSRRLNAEETSGRIGSQNRDLDEDSARKARELRSDIEQTRTDMSETIDAIQEKLRPGNIAAAATDRVKTAASTVARNVADSASQTAQETFERTRRVADDLAEDDRMSRIAGAMIAVGSAWLVFSRWRNSNKHTWRSRSRTYGSMSRRDYTDYGNDQYNTRWRRTPDAHDEYEDVETGEYVDSDEGVLALGYERASAMADDVRDRATRTAYRARNAFSELLESNPLMVGCAAMAVGATIGLALPETERENEWMGETRETLVERAQDMARNTASQVRKAAGDIAGQVASDVIRGENNPE
jgi:hypothetical protein